MRKQITVAVTTHLTIMTDTPEGTDLEVTMAVDDVIKGMAFRYDSDSDSLGEIVEAEYMGNAIIATHDVLEEYTVNVCRTSHAHHTCTIKAASRSEAESIALGEAGDHLYNENNVEYSVE
jgi:hypothetical protein